VVEEESLVLLVVDGSSLLCSGVLLLCSEVLLIGEEVVLILAAMRIRWNR
jgi:hypothetical protein